MRPLRLLELPPPAIYRAGPRSGHVHGGTSEEGLAQSGREKIRLIKNIIELIGEVYPELKVSKQEAEDLRVPLPR